MSRNRHAMAYEWIIKPRSASYKQQGGVGWRKHIQAAIGALHAPDQASEESAFICMSGWHQRSAGGREKRHATIGESGCVCACVRCASLMKYNSRTTFTFKGDDVNVRTENQPSVCHSAQRFPLRMKGRKSPGISVLAKEIAPKARASVMLGWIKEKIE